MVLFIVIMTGLVFIISTKQGFASCPEKKIIKRVEDPISLEITVNSWGKLGGECNFYIGQAFYNFSKNPNYKKADHFLALAKKYLYSASKTLSNIYNRKELADCYLMLLEIEIKSNNPNLGNIFFYMSKIPGFTIPHSMKSFLTKLIGDKFFSYNTQFNIMKYPEDVALSVKKIGIVSEQYNISKMIKPLKTEYKKQFEKIKDPKNQKPEIIAEIITLLDKIKNISPQMSGIPTENYKKWGTYFSSCVSAYNDEKIDNKCLFYKNAFTYLKEVSFDFSADIYSARCFKEFACLSVNIQQGKSELISKRDSISNKKQVIQRWKKKYSTINNCDGVDIIGDQRPFLDEMLSFFEAFETYTSDTTKDSRLISFFQNPNTHIESSLIQDLKALVATEIDKKLHTYNTVLRADYPENTVILARKLGITTNETQQISSIKGLKDEYFSLFKTLKEEPDKQNKSNIDCIITIFNEMNNVTGKLDHEFTEWHKYFTLYEDALSKEDINNKCKYYTDAYNQYKKVNNIFSFVEDVNNSGCMKKVSCLSKTIQNNKSTIIPKLIDTNSSRDKKYKQCKTLINIYNQVLEECKHVNVIEDQQPFLSEIVAYYDELKLFKQNRTNVQSLIEFVSNAKISELKKIAGFYIEDYFYIKISNDLKKGFGNKKPSEALSKIASDIQIYSNYRPAAQQRNFDIVEQHQLLNKYFQDNKSVDISKIDPNIKNAWKIQSQRKKIIVKKQSKPVEENVPKKPSSQPVKKNEKKDEGETWNDNTYANKNLSELEVNPAKLREAVRSFNTYEYLEAWKHYESAYNGALQKYIDSLNKKDDTIIIQNSNGHKIDSNHKIRLKLLSMIMKMKNENYYKYSCVKYLDQERQYPENISWHFAEKNHTIAEKNSDINFFKWLSFFFNQPDQIPPKDYFFSLFSAYTPLISKEINRFDGKAKKRIENKKKRVEYWLKNTWNKYDQQSRDEIYEKKYNDHKIIFDDILGNKTKAYKNRNGKIIVAKPDIQSTDNPVEALLNFSFEWNPKIDNNNECKYIKQFWPKTKGTSFKKCLKSFTDLAGIHRFISEENYFAYYFALSQIRKKQGQRNHCLENLILAYSRAKESEQKQTICNELILIKKDCLQEARAKCLETKSSEICNNFTCYLWKSVTDSLKKQKFLSDCWYNSNIVINYNLNIEKIDTINSPEAARTYFSRLNNIKTQPNCKKNYDTIIKSFFEVHEVYMNSAGSIKKEYSSILLDFLRNNKCLSPEDKGKCFQLFK